MLWQRREPQPWPQQTGVAVLEAEPGEARDGVVARWLSEHREGGGPTWWLQCGPQEGGLWAGLSTRIEDLVPPLRERATDLLSRHAHELCLVVPALKSQLTFPQSLTDTVDDEEKTRNYAADRAYRSLHGLIGLLSEWHELTEPGPLSIACDGYEDSNALVRRFFAALVRRRGAQPGLHVLVVVAPQQGEEVTHELDPATVTAAVRLALPPTGHGRFVARGDDPPGDRARAAAGERPGSPGSTASASDRGMAAQRLARACVAVAVAGNGALQPRGPVRGMSALRCCTPGSSSPRTRSRPSTTCTERSAHCKEPTCPIMSANF